MYLSLYRAMLAGAFLASLFIPVANADIALDLKDNSKWSLTVGGYWPDSNTSIRIDREDGSVGTTISGEDNLGWEERTFSPFFSLGYRFKRNHSLYFSYWSIRRSGVKEISFDIIIDDETYSGGTTIDSQFKTDIYRLTYAYKIYKTKESNISVLAGLHVTDMSFKLNAVGTASGLSFETDKGVVAPLPTIGVSSNTYFGNNWYLSFWLQAMRLTYENVEGRLNNTSLAISYKPHKHVFYSFGAIAFDLSVNGTDGHTRGEFKYEYEGPFISVGASL